MNKIEILKKLLALLEKDNVNELGEEFDTLIKSFYAIYNSEKKEKQATEGEEEFDEEENDAAEEVEQDDADTDASEDEYGEDEEDIASI